jgi:small subunit ribosomal protein S7
MSSEVKLFNKYSMEGIKVQDPSLAPYINLTPKIVPRTGGRNIGIRFHKSKTLVVERLMNHLMVTGHKAKKHKISSGHNTGKANIVYKAVENAFEIMQQKTKKNPVEVLVRAIENAAPREEIIAIEYGGARYPKAIEMSPQRRVDYALRLFCQAAYHKGFRKKKKIWETLADEIVNAYNLSNQSDAIAKKLELERQADSSR